MINFVNARETVWCDVCWTRTGAFGRQIPSGWEERGDAHLCPEHVGQEIPSAPVVLSKKEREARLTETGIKLPAK